MKNICLSPRCWWIKPDITYPWLFLGFVFYGAIAAQRRILRPRARRFQQYRTPGPSQQTNLRLNGLFCDHLEGGGQIELDVATDGVEVGSGGRPVPVDLNDAAMRNLVESAGIVAGKAGGLATPNR